MSNIQQKLFSMLPLLFKLVERLFGILKVRAKQNLLTH